MPPALVDELLTTNTYASGKPDDLKACALTFLAPGELTRMARILIAEDDPSMRGFLARALVKAGHMVVEVPDGDAAMNRLHDSEFDLLLADIVMPGINGIELAKHVNNDTPQLKVMLITGFAAVALKARGEINPGAKVLSKPFHLNTLVDEVGKLLAA